MKFLKSISLFFCMMVCLGGGIWLGAWGQRTFYPGVDSYIESITGNGKASEKTRIADIPDYNGITEPKQSVDAFISVSAVPDRITADTIYRVREYDLNQNTSRDSICQMPISYIGMDREAFLREMNIFMSSPPLSELEKGFASLEVSEFSSTRVTVSKYYRESDEEVFWLHVENNFLVVFREDGKTRYEITDIYLPYLPEELQQEIIRGKKIEGKNLLYNFLESYSS